MAEDASSQDITITVKGPSELKLSITIAPSKTVADLKETIASKSDVEKDRQRLIYSVASSTIREKVGIADAAIGKVLKDEDPISQYKIQNGHTIHMVKGASKAAGQPSTSAAQAPRLPQMGTGLNVANNPVDNIENIQHGLAGFNPFAGMQGLDNLNDPNAMAGMMQNPEFLRQMADMMSRPEVIDQMVASNPQLAGMAPQIRQMMQNPMVRQMLSNPETLRMIMQMQSQMGGQGGAGGMGGLGGLGGMGGLGGLGGFGLGGAGQGGNAGAAAPPTEPFPNLFAPNAGQQNTAGTTPAGGAGAGGAGTGQAPANPFAALFGGGGLGGAGGAGGAGAGGAAGNPFGFDPSMLFGPGGMGSGGSPWGAPAPRDTRPPEEIYATQLGQLNGMGLWDAQKNIRALRTTGGNVEAAIELIFSGQMDGPAP